MIAPLSTISNWEQEVKRFAPAAPVHLLYPQNVAEKWWDRLADTTPCKELGGRQIASIFVTSYDMAIGIRRILDEVKWSFIVVDEGHRIKNRKCRLTTVLKSFESRNRLLLTGTPHHNNIRIHESWRGRFVIDRYNRDNNNFRIYYYWRFFIGIDRYNRDNKNLRVHLYWRV